MTKDRLERPIIGIPAELGMQDGRSAHDHETPVDDSILLACCRIETLEMLSGFSPADYVGRLGLSYQEWCHCRPRREGRRGVVIPTGRPIQESAPGVAQLQADANRRGRPHQRRARALVLDEDGAREHVV